MIGTIQNSTVFADSTTYRMSRTRTCKDEVASDSPHTKTISITQMYGSQSQAKLGLMPEMNTNSTSRPIWINRCRQLANTDEIGMISRGTGTRLINPKLSATEV